MGSLIVPDRHDNVEMNTDDLANAGGCDDAKPKDKNAADNEKASDTESRVAKRCREATHSQSLACELMAEAINCPATSLINSASPTS